jgi:hypothetical protein
LKAMEYTAQRMANRTNAEIRFCNLLKDLGACYFPEHIVQTQLTFYRSRCSGAKLSTAPKHSSCKFNICGSSRRERQRPRGLAGKATAECFGRDHQALS